MIYHKNCHHRGKFESGWEWERANDYCACYECHAGMPTRMHSRRPIIQAAQPDRAAVSAAVSVAEAVPANKSHSPNLSQLPAGQGSMHRYAHSGDGENRQAE